MSDAFTSQFGVSPVLLAIDFGTQRIGLAISRGSLAEPLKIIDSSEAAIAEITKVVTTESVTKIIIGLSENTMAEKTRQFAAQLKKNVDVPIEFTDETLSSHTVHERLRSSPLQKRRAPIDHYAAAEFLQEYLDGYTAE